MDPERHRDKIAGAMGKKRSKHSRSNKLTRDKVDGLYGMLEYLKSYYPIELEEERERNGRQQKGVVEDIRKMFTTG